MSKLRFSQNLFLESQELSKFQKFIFDEGFERLLLLNSQKFGVVNNTKSGENFSNGLVSLGTNVGTIKHEELFAIDVNGKLTYKSATDNIALINNNSWYWLKIKYTSSANEQGFVSIDGSGNVTGDASIDFTEILRGQPNIPSRVAFSNAILNTGEYDVLEVIDNDTVILQGIFVPESGLIMKVVGSFTPDTVPSIAQKDIFQYDSCSMTLVLETITNTPPTLIQDEEFVLARVKRNGATVIIEDKRLLNIYKTHADHIITNTNDIANPLLGIEAIKFDDFFSTRENNLVYLSWAFRSNNWTIDTNLNKITLNAGLGGKFKSTSDFTDGDFDGWRLYLKDGTYNIIQDSYKSGSQINLIIDSLEPTKFTDTTAWILVTPDYEEIELYFSPTIEDQNSLLQKKVTYPINTTFAVVPLLAFDSPTCQYGLQYRYKTFNTFGTYRAIPSDVTSGFLNESSFDDQGNQIDSNRTTYTGSLTVAFITITQATNAYRNIIDSLTLGDLPGLEYVSLNTDVDPVIVFKVGNRKQNVIITNDVEIDTDDSDLGSYNLTADSYLDFRTDQPANIRDGNFFLFQLRGEYVLNGFTFQIVQNFVNSGDPGDFLYELTQDDLDQASIDNLFFRATFDGTNWVLHKVISFESGNYVPTTRLLTAGNGLSGGGNLGANRTFDVNVDNSTIEINSDSLRIKDAGVVNQKIQDGTIQGSKLAAQAVTQDKINSAVAGAGLSWSGGPSAISVNVDGSSVEISSDTVRLPNGYKAVQSPDAVQLYTKVLSGSWNMDTTQEILIAHGLTLTKIRMMDCYIIDNSGGMWKLDGNVEIGAVSKDGGFLLYETTGFGSNGITNLSVALYRKAGGLFDAAGFNASTYKLTIMYEA